MATYLLTWNPGAWHWDDITEYIDEIERNGRCESRWSCGRNKKITAGDRLFLICLGESKQKGICASGWATSSVFDAWHWDPEKKKLGNRANYIWLDFDVLLDPEKDRIFPRMMLKHGVLAKMHWDSQTSGISIPDEVANELEKLWAGFLGKPYAIPFVTSAEEIDSGQKFFEGATKQVSINVYERDPQARIVCIQHYGIQCSVCGFDFEKVYGELGEGFIHVHHLKSISEIGKKYEVDPIKDLRPVCPNCHAMIHKRKPAYTIEELKTIIAK